jgi:putative tricarboxylic transport membrane protein
MIETLLICILGIIIGTITGLVPGIGVTVAMIFCFPFLIHLEVFNLIIFYVSLACMVQYSGSLTSIYFGIPGETNSLPASIEGIKFTKKNKAGLAIGLCAIGSLIGGTIAVIITYPLLGEISNKIVHSLSTNFKSIIFFIVVLFCCFGYNKKKFLINLLLCSFGYFLSLPGESNLEVGFNYTLGIESLQLGVPLISLLTAFIVIPTILSLQSTDRIKNEEQEFHLGKVFLLVKKNIRSIMRGGIVGYICGFIPGVSTTLSSNTAYVLENKLNRYSVSKKLVASETANNSGQFASILPLFLLGIPITGSEVILYDLLVTKGWEPTSSIQQTVTNNVIWTLIPWFILTNILAVVICWPLSKTIIGLLNFTKSQIKFFLTILILVSNIYLGYIDNRVIFYLIITAILSVFGVLLRKHNCMPLIFIFILGKEIAENITRQLIMLS